MKKFLKRFVIIFFITLFVLIGLVIAVPFIFKDKLIEFAKEEINNNLNAKVDFGTFDLTVFSSFPNLNFEINNVKVVGIGDFEKDTLLDLSKLDARVDIMSVLGDNIKVKGIILDKPKIYVKVLPSGKANWDIAKASADSTAADTAKAEPSKFKLNLDELKIQNATITYNDMSMDMYARLVNFNFTLSGDLTADFTSLDTKTTIDSLTFSFGGVKYMNKAKLEITAVLDADLAKMKFTFKENILKLNELELGFDGFVEMPADDIGLDVKFEAKKTEFKNILSLVPAVYLKDFSSVQTSGKLALNGNAKGIYNDKSLPAFNVNLLIENAMFKYPSLPKSADNINIDVNASNKDGQTDNTVINVKKFHVDFGGNPFDAKILVSTPVSDPNIDGTIKGTIDLAGLKDIVPLGDMTLTGTVTADITMKGAMSTIEKEQYEQFDAKGVIGLTNFTFTSAALPKGMTIADASLNFTPKFLELKSFNAKIGNSDVGLTGNIGNFLAYTFRDELLQGQFTMQSQLFDLNEFMSGSDSETPAETTTESTTTSAFEVPKNIDFTLNSSIGKILFDKIEIQNVAGAIIVKEGAVNMKDLKMNLLDGSMVLNGSYSSKDITKPEVDFAFNINSFDIQKTFKAFNTVQKLAPIGENCNGKFSVGMTFKCLMSQAMEPVLNTVNGEGQLQTKNLVIENSKMFNKISELLKSDKFKRIGISDLSIKFTIKDGKLTVEPFTTKIGTTEALIAGTTGIDQSLDYKINFKIPRKEFGSQANSVLDNLAGQAQGKGVNVKMSDIVNVNALIGGTVTDPTVKLDLKDQAKDAVNDLKDQAKEELERRAKEEADKLKKQAEEQANKLKQEAEQKAKEAQDKAKAEADRLKKQAEDEAAKKKKELEEKAKEEAKKKLNKFF